MNNFKDKMKITGHIQGLESKDNGKTWSTFLDKKNLITNVGDLNIAQLLIGSASGYTLGHWAVGSGATVAARSATVIETEIERFAIDTQIIETITGGHQIVNTLDLGPSEGNGTIRNIGLIAHGPTTTLLNFNAADPDESTHEWKLNNYANVLLPNGKVKDSSLILKFIWRLKFTN